MSGILADNTGRASGLLKAAGGGGIIAAVHNIIHTTRVVVGDTGDAAVKHEFVTLGTFTKSATNTHLVINIALAAYTGYHSRGQFWVKIDSGGTFHVCGSHQIGAGSLNITLCAYIPAGDAGAAGSRDVRLGQTTGVEHTFNILNPIASDHAEYTVTGQTTAIISEVTP